jgi:HEAT repeat protein
LVQSLLLPDAARIRGSVAEALRRMDAPTAEPSLVAALADANPAQRCALLGALGIVGGAASAPAVKPLLADADGGVRIEAAAALGGLARNARAKSADARIGAADVLAARVIGKAADALPENEMRAVIWALAQLDEPRAFDALRKIAADASRGAMSGYAARLLARPRQSLILRP